MKVQIKSADTTTRSGTSKAGRQYTLKEQEAWISFRDGQVRKFRMVVEHAYPVGMYEIDETSFSIDRFDNLELSRLKLVSVASEVRKAS